MTAKHYSPNKLSIAGLFITLGIIYGDIGTSPLYVFKAIVGERSISEDLILGGMSCVFWTLILITTFKYVILAFRADHEGEGGIFVLYGLVKKSGYRWPAIAALIGCSALLADGFITPPISVSSAIEGLNVLFPELPTLPIVITLLIMLFSIQQFGTSTVGRAFGPIMLIWFAVIGGLGVVQIIHNPIVLQAISPHYAIQMLIHYPQGFWILGAVFLCTTGAEALYADMGHCGKSNIRFSWIFVLSCLLLNYFGQAAWLLSQEGHKFEMASVFYSIVPKAVLPFMIALATAATIIASQALISGCFTLVNEAMKLRLWIPMKVEFPAHSKGQIYIAGINWFLMVGCLIVMFIFKESSKMEAAYGLTITIDMLMTSALLLLFFRTQGTPKILLVILGFVFFSTEASFLISNLRKFLYGGWFTFMIAAFLFSMLYLYHRARELRNKRFHLSNLENYTPMFEALMADDTVPYSATNLVYMVKKSTKDMKVDHNIVYSIFEQQPKKAHVYWFVHVDILDQPHEHARHYRVKTIVPGKVFFVRLEFGFKVKHNVNRLFKRLVEEMAANGEVDIISRNPSMRHFNIPADFKFVFVKSMISADNDLKPMNKLAMSVYEMLHGISYPAYKDFGLDIYNIETENAPIHYHLGEKVELTRKDFEDERND